MTGPPRIRHAGWAALLAVLLSACGPPEQHTTPMRPFDPALFRRTAGPLLERRCGNPSCHGNPARPLSIHSVRGWREDPADTYSDAPLSPGEERHNFDAACALAAEAPTPTAAPLARKPLAAHAGAYHGGGAVFDGPTDREYRMLVEWLSTGWSDR